MDPSALEQDGFKFAKTAVELDTKGALPEAIFYYKEATEALRQAAVAGSKLNCAEKADEYMKRVEELVKLDKINQTCSVKTSSASDMGEQRAKFLIKQALEEDEQNNQNEALELYMQGAELCLKSMSVPDISAESKRQFESLAKLALSRGEIIKAESSIWDKLNALPSVSQEVIPTSSSKTNLVPKKATNTGRSKSPNLPRKPLGPDFSISENNKNVSRITPTSSGHPKPSHFVSSGEGGSGGGYTKEEIAVLRSTSFINRREYVPFMSVDLKERFGFPVPFTDKDGMLELSAKQKKRLGNWARPSDFASEPQMILAISSFSIKQTVVSDCSFVASIAISASYERKYRKKLITSIIYPQNKNGEPMYNPCGKYMVKLHLNGVSRKVIIDDYLPVDRHGELLCSYSSNRNELWVSLIEKAYMKVMGGYDFPGSNSNIDLHALTGWIPERQSLRDDSFDKERFFDKIYDRFHRGHCLATISTGVMTEQEESRTGLVATHAYAVLDIQKVQGIRMLQLKNPWSHLRWKGRYSVEDDQAWTPALRKALKYDVELAKQYDNGVFWIDYESALNFYDTFYVSWNPALFPKTTCQHASWFAQEGPVKDAYSIGNSPQYCLEVKNVQDSVIWVLLTRHITEKDDFAQNKEFITLVVYKNEGKKVYYPHSPPPYIDGIRINSPHYLTRIKVPGNKTAPNRFTLVVSQYEKHKNISYTLRVYSVSDFNFRKIVDPYKFKKRINGEWNKQNSGGCANHRDTYNNNPSYQINLMEAHSATEILIELRAPRQYSVGFDLICVQTKTGEKPPSFNSGNFRSGYSMMEFSVPPGIFNIIPCTFSPQQLGSFFLDISSSFESSNVAKVR